MADKKPAGKPSKTGKKLDTTKSPALSEDRLDKVMGGLGGVHVGPNGPGG